MKEVHPPPNSDAPHFDLTLLLRALQHEVEKFEPRVRFQEVGTVLRVGNGVATLSGLPQARTDELVTFPTGVQGMILNLEGVHLDVILLGSDEGIQGGDLVTSTGQRLRVPVGRALLGHVVDPLGRPLDERGPIATVESDFLERKAPGIIERCPVHKPLQTGIKMVDGLVPIGRGQRELIIGDRQTGKTALAVDTIIHQKDQDVICVYVSIGQKKSSLLAVIEALRRYDALAHTIVVAANPDDPPALRYLAPYAGCTMAEFFIYQGHDVLIVYDDLSKHANAYRELSLLLRRPPGREAYPGDIFYLHARLLERAACLSEEAGGGSLTALPIVETQRGNISAYIPTNLISITDGQIVLDTDRFNRGLKPAVHEGLSVSRVGGAAQTQAVRAVAGTLRLELSQYEEVARFARLGTEVDEVTQQQLARGGRLQATLKQPQYQTLSVCAQVAQLYAATAGFLDDNIPVSKVPDFMEGLPAFIEKTDPYLYHHVNRTGEWNDELRRMLEQALKSYHTRWQEKGHSAV